METSASNNGNGDNASDGGGRGSNGTGGRGRGKKPWWYGRKKRREAGKSDDKKQGEEEEVESKNDDFKESDDRGSQSQSKSQGSRGKGKRGKGRPNSSTLTVRPDTRSIEISNGDNDGDGDGKKSRNGKRGHGRNSIQTHESHRHHRQQQHQSNKFSIDNLLKLAEGADRTQMLLRSLFIQGDCECPICFHGIDGRVVASSGAVGLWMCRDGCYALFHPECILKWASSSEPAADATTSLLRFKCPCCQKDYSYPVRMEPGRRWNEACFCGSDDRIEATAGEEVSMMFMVNGNSSSSSSANNTLNTSLPFTGRYKHACPKQSSCGRHSCPFPCCHPGPCPPCKVTIPLVVCKCGKMVSRNVACLDEPNLLECKAVCGRKRRNCSHLHDDELVTECQRLCHDEGECEECTVPVKLSCYCGAQDLEMPCCEAFGRLTRNGEYSNANKVNSNNNQTGIVSCHKRCSKPVCPHGHECTKPCHPGPCDPVCEFDPSRIKSCPCGSVPLLVGSRKSCIDPIPVCKDRKCMKTVSGCGHPCERPCHLGPCEPCIKIIPRHCVCTREIDESVTIFCGGKGDGGKEDGKEDGKGDQFLCSNICQQMKSCGRHRCLKPCCRLNPPKPASTGNQKKKKGFLLISNRGRNFGPVFNNAFLDGHLDGRRLGRRLEEEDGDDSASLAVAEEEHICRLVCGKKLSCQNHTCRLACHSGPCPRCLESTFTEYSCPCGMTQMDPPFPCGFRDFPICPFPCSLGPSCQTHPNESQHLCHDPETHPCPPCKALLNVSCRCGAVRRMVPCSSYDPGLVVECQSACPVQLKCGHACSRICHNHIDDHDDDGGGDGFMCKSICGSRLNSSCKHVCQFPCHFPNPCLGKGMPCNEPVMVPCNCGSSSKPIPCHLVQSTAPFACDKKSCLLYEPKQHQDQCDNNPSSNSAINSQIQVEREFIEFLAENVAVQKWIAEEWEPALESFLKEGNSRVGDEWIFASKRGQTTVKKPFRYAAHALAQHYGVLVQTVDREPHCSILVKRTSNSRMPVHLISRIMKEGADSKRFVFLEEGIIVENGESTLQQQLFNAIVLQGPDPVISNVMDGLKQHVFDEAAVQVSLIDTFSIADDIMGVHGHRNQIPFPHKQHSLALFSFDGYLSSLMTGKVISYLRWKCRGKGLVSFCLCETTGLEQDAAAADDDDGMVKVIRFLNADYGKLNLLSE